MNREIERALFAAATEITDADARDEFLARVCSGDPALRNRLEKLLSVLPAAEEFFETLEGHSRRGDEKIGATAGAEFAPAPDRFAEHGNVVATRIGRYKLLERLDQGGCGVVYLAEQEEPVRRRVALKIIRLGMDSEQVVARFEAERQALALMDHPHIARVLDAGATDSGRPYFVMELVRGVCITDFCRNHQMNTRERLEIFVQVCYAIQHAHQKGIIHRDIKPSNILVEAHGDVVMPKVIDFGIAKATEVPLNGDPAITISGQFIGTPTYMSPEQATGSGLDVDTRSDIYSLGVLLYELLTGYTPLDNKELADSGVEGIRRTLLEKEPLLPSAIVANGYGPRRDNLGRNDSEAPGLASQLRGDLDWIVMKALEKDRQRRYQTANALAADIRRYLNDEPVVARPPSRAYRFRKLVRRNKTLFGAIAAVALTLVAALGTSTWLYLRERHASREQERLRRAAEQAQRRAEEREQATAAAVFLARNDFPRADQLVARIPDGMMPPSLESVALLRSLGAWRALRAEWRTAADRFTTLQRMILPNESPDALRASVDLMPAAVLLIECDDLAGYERCRAAAIKRFRGTAKEAVAERVLKSCLLAPADETMLRDLAPLAAVATNFLASAHPDPSLAAWEVVALGLYQYRRGAFSAALEWARQYRGFNDDNPSRSALAHSVLAMAYHRLDQTVAAEAELKRAQQLIEPRFRGPFGIGDSNEGYWYDWLIARVILREANSLISSE